MNTVTLALRGLLRNRRRSMMTALAIAVGFSAIALFAGYIHNIYGALLSQAIYRDLLGHLTIRVCGIDTEGKLNPERYLLSNEKIKNITNLVRDEPHIKLITPRLALNGLISNGNASTIFIADGIMPDAMQILQEGYQFGVKFEVIKILDPLHFEKILPSSELINLLRLEKEKQAALLVNTLYGQANALDIIIGDSFNTGNSGTNDKFIFLSLPLAQSLYDFNGADRLTILLDDDAQTEAMRNQLAKKLKSLGYNLEIKTWQDLSDFYNQVHVMFNIIFSFIFYIMMVVVIMGIVNSMSMTVIERTREIGTLRAIGLRKVSVIWLFTVEAFFLTLFGCAFGLLITLIMRYIINLMQISYIPPNSSHAVLLLIDLDVERILFTLMSLLCVGVLAAFIPAQRAANQPIINALSHV